MKISAAVSRGGDTPAPAIEELEQDQRGTLHIIDNKQAIFSPEARDAG